MSERRSVCLVQSDDCRQSHHVFRNRPRFLGHRLFAIVFFPPSLGWDWVTHDAAGFFTGLLVLVAIAQACLFVWQLKIMHDGMADTRAAAEAAMTSAQTAREQVAITKMGVIDLERAYLSVGP